MWKSYLGMAETSPTPYEQALERTQREMRETDQIIGLIPTRQRAYDIIRALEQKYGFWAILTSTEDLKHEMEKLGVDWFINRGYTQENGDELEEIPDITEEMIEELALDIHPWRDIEEDVYPTIAAYLKDTIESLFPDKGE